MESQISARTPSSPICFSRSISVGRPRPGVGSSFQSPVWTTTPALVRMASRFDFGDRMRHRHEFDFERAKRQPRSLRDDVDRHLRRAGLGEAARRQQSRGETRRIDRAAQPWPKRRDGADMILMRVGDDEPEQISAVFLDEGQVRQDQIDAGHVRPGEGDAAIDQNPFALFRRAEPVERGVHADFAEAAERRENDFFLICRHTHCLQGLLVAPNATSPASIVSIVPPALSNSMRPRASMPRNRPSRICAVARHARGLPDPARALQPGSANRGKIFAARPDLQPMRERIRQ